MDQRQIVSGGAIGLYLALPQESGGTTRQDTSRSDATQADSREQNDRSFVSAAQSAKSINRTGGYPDPHRAPLPAGALRHHAPKVGAR